MPQLAELVYDRNKYRTKYPLINLKGFIVSLLLSSSSLLQLTVRKIFCVHKIGLNMLFSTNV